MRVLLDETNFGIGTLALKPGWMLKRSFGLSYRPEESHALAGIDRFPGDRRSCRGCGVFLRRLLQCCCDQSGTGAGLVGADQGAHGLRRSQCDGPAARRLRYAGESTGGREGLRDARLHQLPWRPWCRVAEVL